MAKFNGFIDKETGKRFFVSYKFAWGKKYYSFDGEETWTTDFDKGYQEAKAKGTLTLDLRNE